MKLYNNNKSCHRISFLPKHLSPAKPCSRKLTKCLSSTQKKSRYVQLKSCKTKRVEKRLTQKKEEDHLTKLRQEAYADLHAQLQHYNDEFVARMRYEESLRSVPSTDSICSTGTEDSSIQDLVDLFEAGTVKDYSQLLEWESYTNPPDYFECEGEYGNLW
ncbi:hypothetical protein INT47_011296 [Mucor saturninus]|uniref:Uncharacterized protein n=1 Tax=Mucor saturninus TaxID=64648 RepID=A0A8H7RMZ0_9FUNG|nr:hypothetical protein INT47_011296 [Mucor saturninus]